MATKRIIWHPRFKFAFDMASEFIEGKHKGINIMILIGPSGVGKTTLRHELMRKYFKDPFSWSTGKLRTIEVMARQDVNSYFNSKSLAATLHHELMKPDLHFLRSTHEDHYFNTHNNYEFNLVDKVGFNINYQKTTETDLWPKVINLAKERDLELICIEHADALAKNHANQTPAENMRQLMSVNESIRTKLFLTTATQGYKLWDSDREIRSRMLIVPLLPYDLIKKNDLESFKHLIRAIESDYEFEPIDLIGTMLAEIAAVTGTTIRDIVSLFDRAKLKASYSKRSKISILDLMDVLPSHRDCVDIHKDIELCRTKVEPCSAENLDHLINKYLKPKK